jgi:mitochondrial FAD-linked sulfhydryl oxidase
VNAQEKKDAKEAPLTKEEVGRATWMLLHTIAAQVLELDLLLY